MLTACVNPGGMVYTALTDANLRREQYREAIIWYLDNTRYKIVVVENTNTDLSGDFIEAIEDRRLEVLTFDGNNFDKELGKGYGEAWIIDEAVKRSRFIADDPLVMKITGRLILKNIWDVVRNTKPNTVYVNTRLAKDRMVCLSAAFICPVEFLKKYFLPFRHRLNDSEGYYLEHLLFTASLEWENDGGGRSDFKRPLKLMGISGTSGNPYYTDGLLEPVKSWLRWLCHRFNIYYLHKKG